MNRLDYVDRGNYEGEDVEELAKDLRQLLARSPMFGTRAHLTENGYFRANVPVAKCVYCENVNEHVPTCPWLTASEKWLREG